MSGVKGMHKQNYSRPEAAERIRDRIVKSQIAARLIKHASGEIEMSQSEVAAGLGLLRKAVPDLAAVEITDRREGWADALRRIAGQGDVIEHEPVAQITHDAPQQLSSIDVDEVQPITSTDQ